MITPIFYSFRRCPYAMRARLALAACGVAVEFREILLRDKPAHMIEVSPKATVPVMVLPDGRVIDESFDVMLYALGEKDPYDLRALRHDDFVTAISEIVLCDGPFKQALDHTKYAVRHPELDAQAERAKAHAHLARWNGMIGMRGSLFENIKRAGAPSFADLAIFPFVRQFMGTDKALFYAEDWPHLHSWLDGFLASEIFAHIMVKRAPWQAGDVPIIMGDAPINPRSASVNHKSS